VFNIGPSDAQAVTIADVLATPSPFNAGTLQYSENGGTTWNTWTGSLNTGSLPVRTTRVLLLRGTLSSSFAGTDLSNTGSVSTLTADPNMANNTYTTVAPLVLSADLSIVKTCNTALVVAGQAIEYKLVIANAGPGAAADVTATDYFNGAYVSTPEYSVNNGTTWFTWTNSLNVGTIASGGTVTVLIRGNVLANVRTSFQNTASVTSPTPDPALANNISIYTTDVTAIAELFLTKECNTNPAVAGERIQYTITVSNPGPSDALNVSITDEVPAIINDVEYSLNNGSSWLAWTSPSSHGALPAGNSIVMLIRGVINPDVPIGTLISNTATVTTSTTGAGAPLQNGSKRLKTTNSSSATASTRVTTRADLLISDVSNPDPVIAGQNLTYTIKVTNNGPSDAQDVSVSNSLPSGLTLLSSSVSAGAWSNPKWTVGTLPAGETTTLVLVAKVKDDMADGTILVNTSRVNSTTYDPLFSSNLSSETTRVYSSADLSITKTASPDPVIAGNMITYTIRVTNNGPSNANGVQAADVVPSTIINPQWSTNGGTSWNTWVSPYDYGMLASGASFSFLIRGTVDSRLTPASVLSNTASVTSTTTDQDPRNNSSTFTSVITVCQTAPVISSITQPTCAVATGSVVLSGLPSGSWTINPGAISGSSVTATINGLTAGATYNFTVTNAAGCTSQPSENVVINAQPSIPAAPVANNVTVNYDGSVHTASASVASGQTIDWFTGATNAIATTAPSGIAAGTYSAWAQARNSTTGCVSSSRTQVTLIINLTIPVISSSSTAGSIYGSAATYQIAASNSPTSYNASGLPSGMVVITSSGLISIAATTTPGVYNITVSATNSSGTGTKALVYTVGKAVLTPGIIANSKCFDNNTSATLSRINVVGVISPDVVTITAGSVSFSDAAIGNGKTVTASGLTLGGSGAGNYVLSSTTATTTANIRALPGIVTLALTQPTCSVAKGKIEVIAPLGTDLTYSINGTDFQTSTMFSNLTPGSYLIWVRNITGCTNSSTLQIINEQPLTPAAPTVIVTQPTCDLVTGIITVKSPIGAGLTYSINGIDYQSSTTFVGVSASTLYQVTVRSSGGCTSASSPAAVNEYVGTPAVPVVTTTRPTCEQPVGSIQINSPLGVGLSYSINGTDYQTYTLFSGLEPGTYQVTVKTTTGCVSAPREAVVVALTPVILATDDIGTLVNGYVGGTSVTDILLNDILTCGIPNLGTVNLTMISSSSPKVRLVGSGVVVDRETPTGFYEVVYRICDKLNPGNCATATVTVPVQNSGPAFLIDAFDDAGKVLGTTGGIAVQNVLANDKLGQAFVDPAKVNLTFISSTNPKITMQGAAVVVAENTPAGTYALVYQISEKLNPTNSDQANVTVIVESSSGIDPNTNITSFDLNLQNYPNPFSYQTTIAFELPEAGTAILKVYDMVGQEVGQIDQTEFNRGMNKVVWNSVTIQKGMYILRMVYKGRMTAKTITIVN
jgi:uncharacterized repeat protein (TIGR01451 family)